MNRNPSRQGIPFVLSGPSGCGKGTIVKALLEKYPDQFALSVSATTRAPRPGEENGVHYHFISGEEFERRIAEDEILEYTTYCGNYYGTPKKELYERTAAGINVILEIEVEGAMNVRRLCPEAVLIFVLPPDPETLEARLRGRGTNTEEDIKNRLLTAKREIAVMKDYDYVVINEDGGAEIAAKEIAGIIFAEQHKIERCPEAAKAFIG
ncbi:MAG: guanylate kinase [Clostridia bacterium]|nr:guanylate kinase [Clostridia bacterium]